MLADVTVDCDAEQYVQVTSLAWAAILVYAVGLIGAYAILLFLARDAILSETPTALSTAIRFLYKECTPTGLALRICARRCYCCRSLWVHRAHCR